MTSPRNDGLNHYPANRVVRLTNLTCPYCGREFSEALPSTKEHVVGRKFVPTGSLHGASNFIFRACGPCNNIKSDLEDDISVITMHPDSAGRYAVDDQRLRDEVSRKARKSLSRRTRKPVAEGEPPFVIRGHMGNAFEMTFTMHSPPQVDEDRLFLLARLQLQAFFYFLTFQQDTNRGRFWGNSFEPIIAVRREDWGNPQLLWFESETKNWIPRLILATADGFFKAWIKRRDEAGGIWAWVLEWNQNFRLAGFFGMEDKTKPLAEAVPPLKLDTLHESENRWLKMRTEIPLKPEQDTLFEFEDVEQAPAA